MEDEQPMLPETDLEAKAAEIHRQAKEAVSAAGDALTDRTQTALELAAQAKHEVEAANTSAKIARDDLRKAAKTAALLGVARGEIARLAGVSDSTVSSWLRTEGTKDRG